MKKEQSVGLSSSATANSAAQTGTNNFQRLYQKRKRIFSSIYRQPCVQLVHLRWGWLAVALLALLLPWIVSLFDPFDFLSHLPGSGKHILWLYSLAFFLNYFVVYSVMARYFTRFFDRANWCCGRQVLCLTALWLLTSVSMIALRWLMGDQSMHQPASWFQEAGHLALLGIPPLLLLQPVWQTVIRMVGVAHAELTQVETPAIEYPQHLENLVYVQSKLNDKKLHYLEDGQWKIKTIRCSFIELKQMIPPDMHLQVCNKSEWVNVAYIDKVYSRKLKRKIRLTVKEIELDVSGNHSSTLRRIIRSV